MEEVSQYELKLFDKASMLPEEYQEYFIPPFGDKIIIPNKDSKVGAIEIRLIQPFISIKIGDHTDARFSIVEDAIVFIKNVVTDKIVFYFQDDHAEYYDFDEFENLSEADDNYYVWSGPFKYAFLDKHLTPGDTA